MKKIYLFCLVLCTNLCVSAQVTSLTIDNQTPGWLSSKIDYADQQTVRNLKVTGYINSDDLKFIGTLISSRALNGELDLSECNIVGLSGRKDNVLDGLGVNGSLRTYRIPKSAIEVKNCISGLQVDSLWFDCNIKYISQEMLGKMPTTLITGNKIDSIPNRAFFQYENDKKKVDGLECVILKGDIHYIGDRAFPYIKYTNFNDFTNLRYLGQNAFSYSTASEGDNLGYFKPDTIMVPKSLNETYYLFSFAGKDEQHIFIEDNIKYISGMSWKGLGGTESPHYNYAKLHFHFNIATPPSIIDYPGFSSSAKGSKFETSIVYVPKGAKQAYLNSQWKYATIIELNPVEVVNLSEQQITLNKQEQYRLSVAILPEDADDKSIEWKSEDETIATVDTNGIVTAIKEGETKIYATSIATGIQDFCIVIIRKNVTEISLEESQISLADIGETKQLGAVITPDDATDKSVKWESSNKQVCTVSNSGLVTATGVGTALVTVTTIDGGHTATCVVKVLQHVSGVSVDKHSISLKVGEKGQIEVNVSPDNADERKVIWTTSNEVIASVSENGLVTALKAGEAWIKATSVDNSEAKDSCLVTVIQPVTGIMLSEATYELNSIGQTVQLKATVMPEDASNKAVTWKSSDTSICLVNNGNVVATGFGVAVVMATTDDGGYGATCVMTVKDLTDGVDEVGVSKNLPVYDLMGRKVMNTRKGCLYLRGGKKFIAK